MPNLAEQTRQGRHRFGITWSIFIKLLLTALLAFLAWNIYDFTRPDHAPIKKVKVVATYAHITAQQLQETIKPFLASGFFYINVIRLQNQLMQFPWVHHALVAREWPATLIIKIDEQTPFANWGRVALLNQEGKLFTPAPSTFPQHLPTLSGPEDQITTIIDSYLKMSKLLAQLNFSITEIDLNPQHIWHLTVLAAATPQNKIEILVAEDKAIARLERLTKVYHKILAHHQTPIQLIDLRYNNGIAIR